MWLRHTRSYSILDTNSCTITAYHNKGLEPLVYAPDNHHELMRRYFSSDHPRTLTVGRQWVAFMVYLVSYPAPNAAITRYIHVLCIPRYQNSHGGSSVLRRRFLSPLRRVRSSAIDSQ